MEELDWLSLRREGSVMGVREIERFLEQWQLEARDLRRRMIVAPTPRERERWCAMLMLAQGWTASTTAEALERDPHTIGRWAAAFGEGGPAALIFEQTGGSPRSRQGAAEGVEGSGTGVARQIGHRVGQLELESGAVVCAGRLGHRVEPQQLPELPPSPRGQALHRLGFVLKRPKKRLVKADNAKRESFVAEYAALWDDARRSGAKIYFADEAHFRADAELRGKWVQKGEPALVDSSSPRYGEKASYYSAVCLERGEVEWMDLEGNSNAGTSAAFLKQLRERHCGRLHVIWDNATARRGEAMREYLRTPGLGLRLVNLPGYSPDFNGDEAIWGWAREEATGNLCLGTRAAVQERVGNFLHGLSSRKDEVKRRCRPVLQSMAEGFLRESQPDPRCIANAHPTLALV